MSKTHPSEGPLRDNRWFADAYVDALVRNKARADRRRPPFPQDLFARFAPDGVGGACAVRVASLPGSDDSLCHASAGSPGPT